MRRGTEERGDLELAGQQLGKRRKWKIVLYIENLENALMLFGFAQASRELRRVKD